MSDTAGAGGEGAGAGEGQDNGQGAGDGGGQQQQASAFDWATAPGMTPERMNVVTGKGWDNPGALIDSYANLEKLARAPEDSIIRLPKERTPEAMKDVYTKLGRPESAEDYSLKVPEGDDGAFSKTAAGWFHEAGLNQSQVEVLNNRWNEFNEGLMKQHTEAREARDKEQIDAIKREWGPQEQANLAIVDRAANAFGMNEQQVAALKEVMGPGEALKFLFNIGSKLGVDDTFVSGDQAPSFGSMTPEQAKAQIEANRKDPAFVKRFTQGDRDARAEMSRLNRLAYPVG